MKKNRLIITTKFIDLNKYTNQNRSNPYLAASTKKKTTEGVMVECLKQRYLVDLDKDALHDIKVFWIVPNNKKDPDNVSSEIKFLLDGVVLSGLISNDGRKNIRHISHFIRTIKDKEFAIIRFIKI